MSQDTSDTLCDHYDYYDPRSPTGVSTMPMKPVTILMRRGPVADRSLRTVLERGYNPDLE